MEQREQDYMPFRLLSPSRKTQLWSSHGHTHTHTHTGTRKKVVAPPPSPQVRARHRRYLTGRRGHWRTTLMMWRFWNRFSQQRRRGAVKALPHVRGYFWKLCLSSNVLWPSVHMLHFRSLKKDLLQDETLFSVFISGWADLLKLWRQHPRLFPNWIKVVYLALFATVHLDCVSWFYGVVEFVGTDWMLYCPY